MDEKKPSKIEALFRANLNVENGKGISPYGNWLGGKLVVYERGHLEKEYTIRPEMTNAMKTLHGGVTAGILDEIIGATLYSMELPTFQTTVNLVVDYFYPAYEGQVLIGTASLIKSGKKITHLQGELYLKDNRKLIARAITNMFATDIPINLDEIDF